MTQTAPPLARRLAAPALSLLALTTPALAQFDGGNGRSFDLLATTGELGACSATASGHLFGELSLDAVLLFEETPMVFKAPEVYRSRCDLSVTANDVAVWPRFELGEGPDWIFVTGPAGLSCFVWNPSTRAFEDIAPIDQSGSDWLDSPDVGIADLDGNPSLDIYGVSADRTKVMLSRFVTQVWHNYLPTSFTGPILAVEPVAWDMLPNQELAVRTPDKLYIIDLFGVELDSVDLTQPGQLMRVIDIPGAVNQAVFVFSNGAAGPHQWLDILSQSGIHQTIDFGSIEPVGIQLGDFDLEGTDDFVLSHTGSPDLPLWRAELQGGNLQFSQSFVEPHIPVLHWHSTQFNQATPAVADFDSDSDPDVLFAPVGTDRIDLSTNETFDETSLFAKVHSGSLTLETQGGRFEITLEVPAIGSAESGSTWTDVKVTVWRQPRFDYFLLPDPFIPTTYHPIVSDEVVVPIQTPHFEWFEDIYHIEARLVRRVAGVPFEQGPGYTAMVGLAEPLTALWEIEGLPDNGTMDSVFSVPPEFDYPEDPRRTFVHGRVPRNGGSRRAPGSGPSSPGGSTPTPPNPPEGAPNPLFEGHPVRYDHDPSIGTWGGGSGALPDLPKTPINFPPLS